LLELKLMTNSQTNRSAARRLGKLGRELDLLESGRASLIGRIEEALTNLEGAGQRLAAMRATVDLFCDHLSSAASIQAEIEAIEREIFEAEKEMAIACQESSELVFEVRSLEDSVEDAEAELERLSSILIEGRGGHQRGH
jgi:chromosome segregation ATPase